MLDRSAFRKNSLDPAEGIGNGSQSNCQYRLSAASKNQNITKIFLRLLTKSRFCIILTIVACITLMYYTR